MSHAVLDREAPVREQLLAEWYFRHAGDTFGPYDRASLRDVIVAARVNGGLELRCGTQREWQKVSSIPKLLERIDAGSPPDAELTVMPIPANDRVRAMPSQQAVKRSAATRRNSPDRSTVSRRPRPTFFKSLARRDVTVVVALLMILLVVNAVVVGSFSLSQSSERKYTRKFLSIWDDLRELRRHDVPDAEWSAFQSRADDELRPIVKDLEKTADVNDPARKHLLWAGRDYLPKMLRDARRAPSESEQFFERHMEESRRLRAARR